MMMKKLAYLSLFLLFPIFIQAQDKVYLTFFESMNTEKPYQYSITKLYKTYLETGGRYEVIMSEKRDSLAVVETTSQARESAEAMTAGYFITGELNQVGKVIVISVSLHTTSDGKKIWHSVQKAYSERDIELVVERLAKMTGTGLQAEDLDNISNVTDYDAKRQKRRRSVSSLGIAFGGAYPYFGSNYDEEMAGGFGLTWSFDAREVIFDIQFEGFFNDVNSMFAGNINILYPFGDKTNAPFVMAGLGAGGLWIERESEITTLYGQQYYNSYSSLETYSKGGVIGYLGGGYIVHRADNVNLRLSAKGFFAPFEVLPDQDQSYTMGGIVTLGINFSSL